MKNIGSKLIALRKLLGWTQKDLAAKLPGGTDYTYIGKIERDEQVPSLKILQKIASVTKADLEYFFTDKPADFYLDKPRSEGLDSRIARTLDLLSPDDKAFIADVIDVFNKYSKFSKPAAYAIKSGTKVFEAAEKGRHYKILKKNMDNPKRSGLKKGE